jgi:hypothetical protein
MPLGALQNIGRCGSENMVLQPVIHGAQDAVDRMGRQEPEPPIEADLLVEIGGGPALGEAEQGRKLAQDPALILWRVAGRRADRP